ncbi:hypothetical protein C1H46_007274 [Malus baccata]|uniref:Uncharacterized protein n=1 Tax=Malus baccata TaxID=106549 RepID=A0A540N9B1_MALBA|nr:hypothetical protein C1H46_007274 [Malus baccata]
MLERRLGTLKIGTCGGRGVGGGCEEGEGGRTNEVEGEQFGGVGIGSGDEDGEGNDFWEVEFVGLGCREKARLGLGGRRI